MDIGPMLGEIAYVEIQAIAPGTSLGEGESDMSG